LQDELLGLADDPGADPVFRTAALDLDVLYRAGETQQVEREREREREREALTRLGAVFIISVFVH
jgi:hypothetical protein